MKHFYDLNHDPFISISSGHKDIEMRLYDEKRKLIHPGDIIVFEDNVEHNVIEVEVIALHVFPSFKELYEAFDKTRLGYEPNQEAHPDDMLKYYSRERMNKYQVVGIEIRLIK